MAKSLTIPRVNLKGAQRPPSVQEFTRDVDRLSHSPMGMIRIHGRVVKD